MKKYLSLFLIIAVIATSIILPSGVSAAKTQSPKQTTYIAATNVYKNGNGKVFASSGGLLFQGTDGKKIQLEKFESVKYLFYLRGKKVYYSRYVDNGDNNGTFTINIDGTHKEKLCSSVNIIGGYGDSLLYVKEEKVNKEYVRFLYSHKNGTDTKLIKLENNPPHLFNGNIYYGNKVYNLDTKKTSTFSWKNPQVKGYNPYIYNLKMIKDSTTCVTTKTHMYYIDGKSQLIRLDKSGNKKTVCKNVIEVLGANTNKNVLFVKKNSKGIKTIYRQSSKGKNYVITTYDKLYKKLSDVIDYKTCNDIVLSGGAFVNGKVVIYDSSTILSVKNTGGAINTIAKNLVEPNLISLGVAEKNIYYTLYDCDDIPIYLYYVKNIK